MTDTTLSQLTKYHATDRLARVRAAFALWRRRARERSELAAMNAHDLRDIGISRAEAEFEIRKPFWRA